MNIKPRCATYNTLTSLRLGVTNLTTPTFTSDISLSRTLFEYKKCNECTLIYKCTYYNSTRKRFCSQTFKFDYIYMFNLHPKPPCSTAVDFAKACIYELCEQKTLVP